MYYLSAILLLLFKIPPKKEHFRRLGTSIAKRGHMRLYERIINNYDKDILIFSYQDCRNATFTGSGASVGVINSYRKLEFNDHSLFEKIYFKNRKKNILFFRDFIHPQLQEQGVNTAELVRVSEGKKLITTYFEYLELEGLEPEKYLEEVADIAAQIAHVSFDDPASFPENRKKFKGSTFEESLKYLESELISDIPDIDRFLREVGHYIGQHVEKCLNHGDLSDKNAFKGGKVIDWDNFGFYPVGYDFGLILGLASREELTLEKYLEIEGKIYEKISDVVSEKNFRISLPYFTSVFIRSRRVRVRINKEGLNKQAAYNLVTLLKERFNKISVESYL